MLRDAVSAVLCSTLNAPSMQCQLVLPCSRCRQSPLCCHLEGVNMIMPCKLYDKSSQLSTE